MVKFITENAPKGQSRKARKHIQTAVQKAAADELNEVRAADKARRMDTRRKVVIGAALMALAEKDPEIAQLLAKLKNGLTRPADKKLFLKDAK